MYTTNVIFAPTTPYCPCFAVISPSCSNSNVYRLGQLYLRHKEQASTLIFGVQLAKDVLSPYILFGVPHTYRKCIYKLYLSYVLNCTGRKLFLPAQQ
ncbi:hypothetical protein FKM82_026580 [Ascaphus truei]